MKLKRTKWAAWKRCEACEDYFCRIHLEHVGDCACPDIDTWVAADIDPYTEGGPPPPRRGRAGALALVLLIGATLACRTAPAVTQAPGRAAWERCCVTRVSCVFPFRPDGTGWDPNCDEACPEGETFSRTTWKCEGPVAGRGLR